MEEASEVQEDGSFPVIVMSTEYHKYIIKREQKITTAIIKKL